ncbi:bifunctional hydroxymethylpyrimidine kinase/phosphomethylpyrimidine kinase [Limosilactobacillus reuteri]|uniref:bifunctional hydroxymethylpyrimidine kinase/phosphomethylpyrimidine kinase n=1 Tax=Limosilactobacillus reuteri TaxID=1598 RepID=UPI00081C2681|nr:bifunctional hydroxymethylpyrimidine kinase/phosphomethylpyrimidine kinase [Limosilactobacillus reuteri]MCH5380045.1 bifunctional hydroxymethylpyrimidine kinase/phosphomethylpyrimidine kinase [Limosilactobacillus reuteri]OCW61771.1 bifunctional hydroxymethylpyrimidine kinase/phosphomethylpyrimidine kinase [Limosilactobacillus reuteri]OCW61908.1 bifunctional hydroxymethylpyrimidine kinase/phosphomethylpyrimidine kinase [Limosilactobacillus reuteri]OCW62029.1 bifunctional hydroxymethylpyrimidi
MINDYPQALTIAGTDSGGGAGIPADVKTMQMRGVYSAMVVVAVTAQNTLGVQDALPMPEKLIDEQFASIAGDLKIRACKTGMLADPLRVRAVVRNLKKYDLGPLIVDPVMVAKGGAKLLSDDAISIVRDELIPLASLVTPNIPEACELTGMVIKDKNDIKKAARELQKRGAKNILIKGGHAEFSDKADDYILFEDGNDMWLTAPRVNTKNTHGTGDTISACITAEIAKGHSMEQAIMIGKTYVEKTISKGINVGHGHGPLNHWVKIEGDDLK